MPFTMKDTIQEILDTLGIREKLDYFYSMELLDFVPKALWTSPLEAVEQQVTMPWGYPFNGEALLTAANASEELFLTPEKYPFIPLWEELREGCFPEYNRNDKSAVTLLSFEQEWTARPQRAVIICPGGSYSTLARGTEGFAAAKQMQAAGYRAFVLNYRFAPNRWPEPQKDLALAVKFVRANHDRYEIDPNQLMIMGFSAGGHLVASYTAFAEEVEQALMEDLRQSYSALWQRYKGINPRPNALCLSYPVISFCEECHEESFQNLSGVDESLREKLSIEKQADGRFPKTFLWACEDDDLVPASNAGRLSETLTQAKVPNMLRIYPTGGHGCGTGGGTSASGWMNEMLKYMA